MLSSYADPGVEPDHVMFSITLTKIIDDFAWVLSTALEHLQVFSDADYAEAISLLASSLAPSMDPEAFDAVLGSEPLVDLFIERWVHEVTSKGIRAEAPPPIFRGKISYATLATLPPPSPALSQYKIELATTADVDTLAQLYMHFINDVSNPVTFEHAKTTMERLVQLGEIWMCRTNGESAGYCAIGRDTPRTVAIRNVYVSPEHRRKGVAEAMVRAITRYYLGAQPLGFDGAPTTGPPKGVKREVCLNVTEDYVERVYKRCGFLLGPDDRDPETGNRGWHPTTCRAVQIVSSSFEVCAFGYLYGRITEVYSAQTDGAYVDKCIVVAESTCPTFSEERFPTPH